MSELEVKAFGSFARIGWEDKSVSVVRGGETPPGTKPGTVVEVDPVQVCCQGKRDEIFCCEPGDQHFEDAVQSLREHGVKLTRRPDFRISVSHEKIKN